MTVLEYIAAILETICLCMAIYYFIRGIKTKSYGHTGKFFAGYLLLNFLRRFLS